MRLFLTLCSLVVCALAKPQNAGYQYGSGVSGSYGLTGLSSSSSAGRFQGGASNFAGFGTQSGGISGGFGQQSGGISGGFAQQSGSGFAQQSGGFEAPFVHKQFITVSAPEDNDSLERSKHLVIGRPQKNYRVVFIKAPSSSQANVKLSAEYAPQEEKTVIYVLSKKDNQLEVNDIATPAPTVPSKPEVFFIKYKTEEEAHHAQQQIQAEYDKIEGTSEHTDGGVAPQQSVVGILDGGAGGAAIGGGSVSGGSFGSGSIGGGSIGGGSFGGSSFSSRPSGTVNIGGGSVGGGFSHSGSSTNAKPAYLPPQ